MDMNRRDALKTLGLAAGTMVGAALPAGRATAQGGEIPVGSLLDGTGPTDWPEGAVPAVSSFSTIWPKEIQERVLRRWKEYGFKD